MLKVVVVFLCVGKASHRYSLALGRTNRSPRSPMRWQRQHTVKHREQLHTYCHIQILHYIYTHTCAVCIPNTLLALCMYVSANSPYIACSCFTCIYYNSYLFLLKFPFQRISFVDYTLDYTQIIWSWIFSWMLVCAHPCVFIGIYMCLSTIFYQQFAG